LPQQHQGGKQGQNHRKQDCQSFHV
jgi:hypothetical protein